MRLLAWNIRQGGGSRLARIADALARHEADVLVLSEYHGGDATRRLRAALDTLGYRHATALVPPPGRSGVLIAARCAFRDHGALGGGLPEPYLLVATEFPEFRLVGVYMPNLLAKVTWGRDLQALARRIPIELHPFRESRLIFF
jgi:exonuclease III